MNRRLVTAGIVGLILAVAGLWAWSWSLDHKAVNAETQAQQTHRQADSSKTKAEAHDKAAADLQPRLQKDDALVARLRAELEDLKKHQAPAPQPHPPLGEPTPQLVEAKKDELIGALSTQVDDLKAQNLQLTLSRDQWKLTAELRGREVLQLQGALAARQGLEKAERWKGRLEGFGLGYGAGRLR